jgi:hypothetical protein
MCVLSDRSTRKAIRVQTECRQSAHVYEFLSWCLLLGRLCYLVIKKMKKRAKVGRYLSRYPSLRKSYVCMHCLSQPVCAFFCFASLLPSSHTSHMSILFLHSTIPHPINPCKLHLQTDILKKRLAHLTRIPPPSYPPVLSVALPVPNDKSPYLYISIHGPFLFLWILASLSRLALSSSRSFHINVHLPTPVVQTS